MTGRAALPGRAARTGNPRHRAPGAAGSTRAGAAAAALAAAAVLATPLLAGAGAGVSTTGAHLAGTAPTGPLRAELPEACVPEEIPTEPSPVFEQLGVDERVWELTRGEGVTVAVVDSGVIPSEPHLDEDVVVPGWDPMGTNLPTSESQTEGPPLSSSDGRTDVEGHGTTIAGLIAAREAEDSAVVGIAPAAQILPVRTFVLTEPQGELEEGGFGPSTQRMAEGIRWAADQGAQIINVSQSITTSDPALEEAVRFAAESGSLVVASAGNARTTEEGPGARYPAAYPEALSVTASTIEGLPTEDAIHGDHIDVAAPGDPVWSVWLNEGDCYMGGGESASSYATAYVSAVAALVAAYHPDETPAQWAHRLTATAVRTVPEESDEQLGWGVVAPYAALSFVDDGSAPGPQSPVHEAPSAEAATFVPVPERPEDPLDAVRGTAAWWVFGAFVVVGGAGLVARAPRRRG